MPGDMTVEKSVSWILPPPIGEIVEPGGGFAVFVIQVGADMSALGASGIDAQGLFDGS